jgi:hypothetical protein
MSKITETGLSYNNSLAICVGFEVLSAVLIKSSVFWDIRSVNLVKINRRFGGIYPFISTLED